MEQARGGVPEQRADGITMVSENGVIVSTYYMWQRKVFQAVTAKAEVCFAEVSVVSAGPSFESRAAVVHAGELEIELSSGVDSATIRAIIEALRSC